MQHGRGHPAGRLQRRNPPCHAGGRRAHDPGRGAHGLPRARGRVLGSQQRRGRELGPGPVHVRQGHRRRAAHRGPRWPPRGHGVPGPHRSRVPGGHAVREPGGDGRGSRHAQVRGRGGLPDHRPPFRAAARRSARGPRRRRGGLLHPGGGQPVLARVRHPVHGRARLRRRQGPGGLPVHAVLPRDAGRRGLPAALGVRGVVPLRGARRLRHGPDPLRAAGRGAGRCGGAGQTRPCAARPGPGRGGGARTGTTTTARHSDRGAAPSCWGSEVYGRGWTGHVPSTTAVGSLRRKYSCREAACSAAHPICASCSAAAG